ncbi:MAG: hypothetical protein J7525_14115 [Roseofilum sp. SID3]|uniref:hypothetical protein n=1 Tax=Roseofilum sp. SID3 TaxID=2821499 RepID=UPI001B23C1AC|nr:hypothetical protein [Roseofilum sp. SID3]MBP0014228.1 hypothetical protein [Roseofilum sp. SID3]
MKIILSFLLLTSLSSPALAHSVPPQNLSPTQQEAWDQLVCLGDVSCRESPQYTFPHQGLTLPSSDFSPAPASNPADRVRELIDPLIPDREDLHDGSQFDQSFLDWLMPPAHAAGIPQAQERAYRAIDSIGAAAESSINWFVPAAHIMLTTMLSYRLTFYLIHGPKNS